LIGPATKYWDILTKDCGVVSDGHNYHAYLRVLRVARASTATVKLLLQMPQSDMQEKTFRIAMSTCRRDSNNQHAFSNAGKILDIMQNSIATPDPRVVSEYLDVAFSTNAYVDKTSSKAQPDESKYEKGRQIMRAIDRVGPSYINLRSAVSYGGPTNRAATTQEKSLLLDSVINLTKNLVRAHDIILDQRLVDSEEMKRLVQQRSKLSAYVTRSIHQKTRNNSRSRLSQRADEERRFPHAKKVVSEVRGASRNGFATGGEEEGVMGMEDSDSGKRKLMDQFAEQERRAAETALAT